jgi:membrane-bound lytic murein transglycosylase B
MGRIRGVSSAGAQGPMQFLPTTWDIYGGGGDINDPCDAIRAAARLLRANSAPDDMAGAVWSPAMPSSCSARCSPTAITGTGACSTNTSAAYLLDHGYPEVLARPLG